jgi:hypothetical protein
MTTGDFTGRVTRRVGDQERERAVELLRAAAGDGQISLGELGDRIEAALAARTMAELGAVIGDLPAADTLSQQPARPTTVRLAVSHGHVDRLGAWPIPQNIDLELRHAASALDLRTTPLPPEGVHIHVQATRSTVRILVPATTQVDLNNLGRHKSNVTDRGARHAMADSHPSVQITGDIYNSTLKVLRPRRRWL